MPQTRSCLCTAQSWGQWGRGEWWEYYSEYKTLKFLLYQPPSFEQESGSDFMYLCCNAS